MLTAKNIFRAALVVGTLDILAAFIHFYVKTGNPPFKPVLSFVASGLSGKAAFTAGDQMMLLGLLIHYCIAAAFTLFFFLTIAKTTVSVQQKWLTGIFYGAFIWAVMNLLILPMTNVPRLPKDFWGVITGMLILIGCIGLPLAFINAWNKKTPVT